MYLTAQRVRSQEKTGVNVFAYRHGAGRTPIGSDGYPDLTKIATTTPGVLIYEGVQVKPGGNRVESYLEVAADDNLSLAMVVANLRTIEADDIAHDSLPWEWRSNIAPVILRFYATTPGQASRDEFLQLSQRLMEEFEKLWPSRAGEPYRFRLEQTSGGYTLRCDPDTLSRLQREGRAPAADSISISTDVLTSMPLHVQPFLAHAIAALMNRDLHELIAGGGVVVVDDEGARVWHRLPPEM